MTSKTIETAKKKFSSYKNKKAVPDNQILNILSEETLKYLLLEYRFYFFSITLLLALLIYSLNKTLDLEKELHQRQVIFESRQKAYDEKAKQQREKLERRIKEINLHK